MKRKIQIVLRAAFLMTMACSPMADLFAATSSADALKEAEAQAQYLCVIFYDKKESIFNDMVKQLDAYNSSLSKKAATYKVDVANESEYGFISRYGVMRAKLPLLLVFAPNGVITGGFEQTITVEQLKPSMNVSELMLKVLKPIQERKVVLVTLQNSSTINNDESWKAVTDFTSDPQYSMYTVAIKGDPSASGSKEFIKQCGLIEPIVESTVVVLLPPGSIGKILKGKITKADILSALQSCASLGGCGGGTCGPKK